jgi:hypothetical protein
MGEIMNDNNIHTGICIVLPANHYGADELSHCTVAFLGNTDEVDYPKSRAERLMVHLQEFWYESTSPRGSVLSWADRIDMFGVERNQPVAVLQRSEKIFDLRARAEQLLDDYDIPFSKMFEYTPHVSLKSNRGIPMLFPGQPVKLAAPVLWWGDDRPTLTIPRYKAAPDIAKSLGHPVYKQGGFA